MPSFQGCPYTEVIQCVSYYIIHCVIWAWHWEIRLQWPLTFNHDFYSEICMVNPNFFLRHVCIHDWIISMIDRDSTYSISCKVIISLAGHAFCVIMCLGVSTDHAKHNSFQKDYELYSSCRALHVFVETCICVSLQHLHMIFFYSHLYWY